MNLQPSITITTRDYERLEKLLDAMPDDDHPGASSLSEELERAEVVPPQAIAPSVVTMNSRVTFTVLSTGKTATYTLSYPQDMDGSAEKISILAPVGSALLGLAVGQEIEWAISPHKTTRLRIDNVDYQPERAGDYHL